MKSPNFRVLASILLFALVPSIPSQEAFARNPNGEWQQLATGSTRPPARKHHVMAYDPSTNSVVVFGGEDENDVVLDDAWLLNLETLTWTNLDPDFDPALGAEDGVPGQRHGHSGGIHIGSPSRLLVFGGRKDPAGTGEYENLASDLWSLSLDSNPGWVRLSVGPTSEELCGNCPNGGGKFRRRNHAAAAVRDTFLYVMGGQEFCRISTETPGFFGIGMRDTWRGSVFAGSQLTAISGELAAPCDNFNFDSDGPLGLPTHRYWHSLIHDSVHDRLVVFGGEYFESIQGSSAWYTTNASGNSSWTHIGDAPTGYSRKMHSAIYDPIGERMVVFGGREPGSGGSIYSAVTALALPSAISGVPYLTEGGTWTTLNTGSGPGATAEHAAVYDSEGDRMIVFGGVDGTGEVRDDEVWALDFETPPAAVTISGSPGKTNAVITFTAPGDDGNVGTAAAYDLRRSSSPITEANFGSATAVTTNTPQVAGSLECAGVFGLTRCNTYYYALKTRDSDYNWSPMSNVLSLTQTCNGGPAECFGEEDASIPVTPVTEFFLRVDSSTRGRSVVEFGMAPEQAGESYDVAIFDVAGRRIRVLDAGIGRVGTRSAGWDHVGEGGDPVSSGLYFVRLRVGTKVVSERIVVTR